MTTAYYPIARFKSLHKAVLRLTAVMIVSAAVASCGSSRTTALRGSDGRKTVAASSTSGHNTRQRIVVDQHIHASNDLASESKALLAEAEKWMGTPYLYGGNDNNGIDCSGFVLQVYKNALGIKLPRTSATQHEFCSRIDKSRLKAGDLVFFATTKEHDRVSHVGMYIGEGKMVHASSSRGVIISSLDEDYYTRYFFGAGKVDQYYAMIDTNKKKNKKDSSRPAPATVVTQPAAAPSPLVAEAKPAPAPAAVATAAPTPKPKTEAAPQPAPAPASQPKITAVRATAPAAAPSGNADPRSLVLGSIVEQSIDSIMTVR